MVKAKFSAEENHNAHMALKGSRVHRHTQQESRAMLLELLELMPREYICALLDTEQRMIGNWLKSWRIPCVAQRPIYYLHLMMFEHGDLSVFRIAMWGKSDDPKHKKLTTQQERVFQVFVEMEEIEPKNVLMVMKNRLPDISTAQVEALIKKMVEAKQIWSNPVTGRWRADGRMVEFLKEAKKPKVAHTPITHTTSEPEQVII